MHCSRGRVTRITVRKLSLADADQQANFQEQNEGKGNFMIQEFSAVIAEESDGRATGSVKTITLQDLPEEPILVEVSHSTLNYKDGLAITGKGKIARSLPMVCGIDLAGTIVASQDPNWRAGDRVLVNGYGLSELCWGGLSQYARVRPEWLVRIPTGFSAEQVMAIGTAGYTAMLCVMAIQDHDVKPEDGEVVVTGASGGVGSVATMLLARLGYQVIAASGRSVENESFLRGLGANELIGRDDLSRPGRPLEKERWAAGIDSVGSQVLSTVLSQTRYGGIVAACGLAGGADLPATVLPFILRGVTLRGIDSVMAALHIRQEAWRRLEDLVDLDLLSTLYSVEPMTRVPELAEQLIAGGIRGRIVVDVNA